MADSFAIFTSYSTSDGAIRGGQPFKKFSKLVTELVTAKAKLPRTSLSFIDRIGIKLGDEWEPVLADGVRTAEVLI